MRICVAKLKSREEAGADDVVSQLMKYGAEEMIAVMAMLYYWV